MKHTPGPWTARKGEANGGSGAWGGIDTDDYIVADVWADTEDLEDVAEGNALLMAAAPDLLAACKLAEFCARGQASDHELELHATLLAAIAKAEGNRP